MRPNQPWRVRPFWVPKRDNIDLKVPLGFGRDHVAHGGRREPLATAGLPSGARQFRRDLAAARPSPVAVRLCEENITERQQRGALCLDSRTLRSTSVRDLWKDSLISRRITAHAFWYSRTPSARALISRSVHGTRCRNNRSCLSIACNSQNPCRPGIFELACHRAHGTPPQCKWHSSSKPCTRHASSKMPTRLLKDTTTRYTICTHRLTFSLLSPRTSLISSALFLEPWFEYW